MNIYLFWILFLALWAIVPLMIIKGRVDEAPKVKTSPEIKSKKKGWFNWIFKLLKINYLINTYSEIKKNLSSQFNSYQNQIMN